MRERQRHRAKRLAEPFLRKSRKNRIRFQISPQKYGV
jgi:hypothetical protein